MLLLETNKKLETNEERDILWCEFASYYDNYLYVRWFETGNWLLNLCSIYDVHITRFERYYK